MGEARVQEGLERGWQSWERREGPSQSPHCQTGSRPPSPGLGAEHSVQRFCQLRKIRRKNKDNGNFVNFSES